MLHPRTRPPATNSDPLRTLSNRGGPTTRNSWSQLSPGTRARVGAGRPVRSISSEAPAPTADPYHGWASPPVAAPWAPWSASAAASVRAPRSLRGSATGGAGVWAGGALAHPPSAAVRRIAAVRLTGSETPHGRRVARHDSPLHAVRPGGTSHKAANGFSATRDPTVILRGSLGDQRNWW